MADFDWVRARAECSLHTTFVRLESGVKSDVDARKEIPPANSEGVSFKASKEGDRLVVTRTEGSEVRKVEFSVNQNAILVAGDTANFEATPGLNITGDCTLMVEDQELELWQVRRKALERLFFNEQPPRIVAARKSK
jgi:hypothetical protein